MGFAGKFAPSCLHFSRFPSAPFPLARFFRTFRVLLHGSGRNSFIPARRDSEFCRKAAEAPKLSLLAAFQGGSSWSCGDVQIPSTGVSRSCSSFFLFFFGDQPLSFLLLLPSFFARSLLELSRVRCWNISPRMMEMFGLGKISMLKESQPFLQHCQGHH